MTRSLKYIFAPLSIAFFAYISFTHRGMFTYSAFLYAYAFIPLAEFFLKNDETNLSETEEQLAKRNRVYDVVLYFSFLIHLVLLVQFLFCLQDPSLEVYEIVGRTLSMGLMSTFAINLGHSWDIALQRRAVSGQGDAASHPMMHFYRAQRDTINLLPQKKIRPQQGRTNDILFGFVQFLTVSFCNLENKKGKL